MVSVVPFTIFCLIDLMKSEKPSLPFLPLTIQYVVLLAFVVYFFFEVMHTTYSVPVYQKSIFWIAVAFIINFAGNFFLFLYSKNSYNIENFRIQYTLIYTTVTLVKNVLICVSAFVIDQDSEMQSSDRNSASSLFP
jgi:hypothetical protein